MPQLSQRTLIPSELKVWNGDYQKLRYGLKTEYRQPSMMPQPKLLAKVYPAPVLMWTINHAAVTEVTLMVCLAVWRERLMAMTETSLEREGFETMDSFKRYWLLRTGNRPNPMMWVNARHLRPWQTGDAAHFGRILLMAMYGDAAREALAAEA